MAPFYFNDFRGQRHYAKTREEAEKLRVEVGGGHVITQTANYGVQSSPSSLGHVTRFGDRAAFTVSSNVWDTKLIDPSECGVAAEEIEALLVRVEEIKKLPRDHYCIRAGRAAEAILCLTFMQEDLEGASMKRATACGGFMGNLLDVPAWIMKQAVDLYCKPDGLIAHYRHNAAPPSTFTGHGAFLRLLDGSYSIEHISDDRVTYGKRSKVVELATIKKLLAYTSYLASKNWYSSFLDSSARAVGLTDLPYREDNSFRSWQERAAEGDI